MANYQFTVTVSEDQGGISVQVSGISPFEGASGPALEVAKALRLATAHDAARLADCIAAARRGLTQPATSTIH